MGTLVPGVNEDGVIDGKSNSNFGVVSNFLNLIVLEMEG